ncbi:MAG: winged helix DNA-binding protein [Alphaproteobacteria bacterium]|nr:winged helix DNA-binding protein [Alphaproteobacteria bacterium]
MKKNIGDKRGILELDRHWHLATDDHEIALTELEYSILHSYESFCRWMKECVIAASGVNMSANDCAILNVIAMRDRAKGITEIARLLNRDDNTNIQYTIRKLTKDHLVEKTSTDNRRKGVRYRATATGYEVVKRFVALRKGLLIDMTKAIRAMDEQLTCGSKILDIMTGMYEQAARVAATHRPTFDEEE